MEGLSKKLSNLGVHDIRNAARFAQNMIVQYEPYQIDVRRATNTDSWGPTPKHLQKILRNRFQVPMYLITEYVLKRLVDHMAVRPKNFYEKARKQYVNYGSEWRVVLKCLIVIEFLLLNVETRQELDQVLKCLHTHQHIFKNQLPKFKIEFSADGKMEIHERGIYKKNENILQYLDDAQYLKNERLKTKKNNTKIMQSMASTSGLPGTPSSASSQPYGARDVYGSYDDSDLYDYTTENSRGQDDDDDETNANGTYPDTEDYYINNNSSASTYATQSHQKKPTRQRSIVDEQRRQRRENLKQQIKESEEKRKQQLNQSSQEPVVDLLDFDSEPVAAPSASTATATTTTTTTNNNTGFKNVWADDVNNGLAEDDDDEFGDFQGDSSPTPANPPLSANIFGTSNSASSSTTTSNNNNNDMFADLLSFSKTKF
ncbi:hypothetical protein ACO0QE_002709 [Hanseniaspora vineae]